MILILSNPEDSHARHIMNLLQRRGRDVACLSRADFGNDASIEFHPEARRGTIRLRDRSRIVSEDVSAVWYRRPGRVLVHPAIRDEFDREFADAEWTQTLDSFFSVAFRRIISPPFKQRAATKPMQLAHAARAGLRVPETAAPIGQ
jgi:hypothetical protein